MIDVRDRPGSESEVEVAPAMVLAGEAVLEEQGETAPNFLLVAAIYRAMQLARPTQDFLAKG